jgi:hypothetical protein
VPDYKASARRSEICGTIGAICLTVAILDVAGEAIYWLWKGYWPGLSLASVLVLLNPGGDFAQWVTAPQSWIGVHKIVVDVPLFAWILFMMYIFIRQI